MIFAQEKDRLCFCQQFIFQRHHQPANQIFFQFYYVFDLFLNLFLFIARYFILLHFSNLRRLVHAMILKRPPREWIGTFRLVKSCYSQIISCFYLFARYGQCTTTIYNFAATVDNLTLD